MDHSGSEHVLATFTRRRDAERAADRARRRFPDREVTVGAKDDSLDAMVLGQRREIDESAPMTGIGLFTGPFLRGAIVWGVVGAVVGALLFVPLTFVIDVEGTSLWVLAITFAAAGALGVSSATFILGAGRQAVKEGATTAEDPTAVVRVDSDEEGSTEVIEFFVAASARSAIFVGEPPPRPPSETFEDPRPLPEGRDVDRLGRDVDQLDHDAGFRPELP